MFDIRSIFGLALLAGVAATSVQQPLYSPFREGETESEYRFDWPIQKVAIIGAGPSGLVAYHELRDAGLDIRIFERDSVPGGNWHYTEEVPLDAPVPNAPTPVGDFVPSLPPEGVDLPYSKEFEDDGKVQRDHRGPKSIWESLTCTMPSPLQQFHHWPWPAGTPWELTHYHVRNYVRSYASYLNINSNDENPAAAYNTRVERVEKRVNGAGQGQGWRLWLRSLKPTESNTYRATWWTEDFDAVVVATGSYNAPSMPSIPGLEDWVRRFPNLVHHARQYRRPEAYANQTVLIVGASLSGTEISRDLNHHAAKIYQSYRPDKDYIHIHFAQENLLRRIPKNTTTIGEINQFLPMSAGSPIQSGLVELKNGTILSGIDKVILATGFRYSFPFLAQYYDGETYDPHAGSAATFLPLDGSHIRDLYLDQFYIQDPTLAFIGAPLASLSFSALAYTALALAKVWTDKAKLPDTRTMWMWHNNTVEERGGYGKYFMFLGPQRTSARIAYLMAWLNGAAYKYGGKQVDSLPKYSPEVAHYWEFVHFGGPLQLRGTKNDEAMLASLGFVPGNGANRGWYDDVFFHGDW